MWSTLCIDLTATAVWDMHACNINVLRIVAYGNRASRPPACWTIVSRPLVRRWGREQPLELYASRGLYIATYKYILLSSALHAI